MLRRQLTFWVNLLVLSVLVYGASTRFYVIQFISIVLFLISLPRFFRSAIEAFYLKVFEYDVTAMRKDVEKLKTMIDEVLNIDRMLSRAGKFGNLTVADNVTLTWANSSKTFGKELQMGKDEELIEDTAYSLRSYRGRKVKEISKVIADLYYGRNHV